MLSSASEKYWMSAMHKNFNSYLVVFFLLFLFFLSCKAPSVISKTITPLPVSKKESALMDSMNAHFQQFNWYTAKVKIQMRDSSFHTEFTANIRIRQDSAIWISISPALGIEVARILITADSIRVIDRIHRNSYSRGFDFFNKYTSLRIDLEALQDLIEGNPLFTADKQFTEASDSRQLMWIEDSSKNSILLNTAFEYLTQIIDDSSGSVILTNDQFDSHFSPPMAMLRKIELLKPHPATMVLTFSKVKIDDPQKLPFNMEKE